MPPLGRIALTGGLGFLGSHVVDRLLENEERILLVELPAGPDEEVYQSVGPQTWGDRVEVVTLSDPIQPADELVDVLDDVQAVVHLAPLEYSLSVHSEPTPFIRRSVPFTGSLLQALRRRREELKRVVIGSSASIYGEGAYHCSRCYTKRYPYFRETKELDKGMWDLRCYACGEMLDPRPTPENKEKRPSDLVGITVHAVEDLAMAFGRLHFIPTVALRFFHLYGPRQNLNPNCGEILASAIACMRDNLPPYLFEDGNQVRDFLYVEDAADAVLRSLYVRSPYAAYNVGSGTARSMREVLGLLAQHLGYDGDYEVVRSYRRFDSRNLIADIAKMRKIFDWEPRVNFERGVDEFAQWVLKQPVSGSCGVSVESLQQDGLVRYAFDQMR